MTDARTKLLERIMKLHASAESFKKIGSEAEAMEFARAAQALLVKHELDLSDIEYELQQKNDPIKAHLFTLTGAKTRILWSETIAAYCARAHFCQAMNVPDSDAIGLIGRRQHRQVAEFMIITLVRLGYQLAQDALAEHVQYVMTSRKKAKVEGFTDSFLLAYAGRVCERYDGFMHETMVSHSKTAMIRLSTEHQLVQQVVDEMEAAGAVGEGETNAPKLPPVETLNKAGIEAGIEAGNRVGLRARVVDSGPTNSPKHLSEGQRLLGRG